MDRKHTPGPWVFEDTPDKRVMRWIRAGSGERKVAICEVNNTGRPWEEFLGNRSLIAAAPELAEALEWAVYHLRDLLPGSNTLRDCEAALAKARGEDQ